MKSAEWQRLAAPVLNGKWRFRKSLAYLVPVHWALYGLLAEESAASRPDFYLWMVRMPLVAPTDVVDLSWSERFGGSSRVFSRGSPETRDTLKEAAELVAMEASVRRTIVDPPGGVDNVRMQEARAYGLLLDNNIEGAIEVLTRVLGYQPRHPWEVELARRAEGMRSLLEGGLEENAVARLEEWRSASLSSLEVEPN